MTVTWRGPPGTSGCAKRGRADAQPGGAMPTCNRCPRSFQARSPVCRRFTARSSQPAPGALLENTPSGGNVLVRPHVGDCFCGDSTPRCRRREVCRLRVRVARTTRCQRLPVVRDGCNGTDAYSAPGVLRRRPELNRTLHDHPTARRADHGVGHVPLFTYWGAVRPALASSRWIADARTV